MNLVAIHKDARSGWLLGFVDPSAVEALVPSDCGERTSVYLSGGKCIVLFAECRYVAEILDLTRGNSP